MPIKKQTVSSANKISLKKDASKKKIEKNINFPIIGIGASAGGLETLDAFFTAMPQDTGLAFVIIQHLSPKHKSIMGSLLQKKTPMNVMQIKDGTKVQPNHVYLNPPGKNVAIFNCNLHLLDFIKGSPIHMPVDFFFRSLSEDQAEKAIGIILSGTASDGTLGVRAIKDEGGMAMAQQPDTAKYDGMPKSAVDTGIVDFIVPVEKMPETLIKYVKNPFLKSQGKLKLSDTTTKNQMQKIFAMIRRTTGHDFSYYKPTTISRRIERRMGIHQIKKLSDYVLYLQKNTAEIDELFQNLIIGVTSFFRDPQAYKELENKVLPILLKNVTSDSTIRIWVAGCSTGEEAYSLAIVLSELMDKLKNYFKVQIFATDIDPGAIEFARQGIYPVNIGVDISQKRLRQFFIKEPDGFQVKKQIRDMIVFSIQNLIKDPPFSRLDLVSCRNLMIYMDNVLQNKIIPLFHYTLNHGGILLLGTSESVGAYSDLFETLNKKWKIFKRKSSLVVGPINYSDRPGHDAHAIIKPAKKEKPIIAQDLQNLIERVIVNEYAPEGVLINDKYEVAHFLGKTNKYLLPPMGKPSFNVLDMVLEDLKQQLMITIHKSIREKKTTFCKGLKIKCHDGFYNVSISVKPMTKKENLDGFWLVMFEDTLCTEESNDKKAETLEIPRKDIVLKNLEQELQSTREYLQATIEDLKTSNEELKSTNEELQSVNEEMQSSNEELETSKEELQSTNEELSTVNSELSNKMDDYSKASNDMNNLLAATQIATIFIDINLCIKNFTPAATKIINLIPTDVGRPLNDLKTNFKDVDLIGLTAKVLKDLNSVELDILSVDNIWYSLKIIPYRTMDNIIDGVVMTFFNVDKIKQADKFKRLATVLSDSNDAITVQDLEGNILAWNKGATQLYGWTESQALKMNIREILPKDNIQDIYFIVEKLLKGDSIPSFKTKRKTKDGTIFDVWMTITALSDKKGQLIEFATTERDLAWLSIEEVGNHEKS
jgi:two-component system CheB/CheR fusion protein